MFYNNSPSTPKSNLSSSSPLQLHNVSSPPLTSNFPSSSTFGSPFSLNHPFSGSYSANPGNRSPTLRTMTNQSTSSIGPSNNFPEFIGNNSNKTMTTTSSTTPSVNTNPPEEDRVSTAAGNNSEQPLIKLKCYHANTIRALIFFSDLIINAIKHFSKSICYSIA